MGLSSAARRDFLDNYGVTSENRLSPHRRPLRSAFFERGRMHDGFFLPPSPVERSGETRKFVSASRHCGKIHSTVYLDVSAAIGRWNNDVRGVVMCKAKNNRSSRTTRCARRGVFPGGVGCLHQGSDNCVAGRSDPFSARPSTSKKSKEHSSWLTRTR